PTLHIPPDNDLPYLHFPKQMNPFLPYPPIPLSLPHPQIFTPQLPPLLPPSLYPKFNIIFPILPTIKQFPHPKSILLQHKQNLLRQPYQLSHHIQLAIILQIPPT
ncbi:putative PEP-binding protein, partial [Staphylococcus epidermidis]|uniref:putative PEP-binding protein n=1 Tax=Staphylococcus epidermidis TaxID=1282 RepID=UPI0028CB2D04